MSTFGSASSWDDFFPDHLVGAVLDLLTRCWDQFPKPSSTELEVKITQRFREALVRDKDARLLPFSIWPESSETDPETGKEVGRIDLRFLHGYREKVYLAFECKRLRILNKRAIRSNVGEYVGNEGMMRHVSGKYSQGMLDAGMIGYVMDGRVSAARSAIRKSIRSKASSLFVDEANPLSRSVHRLADSRVAQSQHALPTGELTIHHVLLAI